ncbi:hypothetical protein [Saccharopolyspora antimicrobica]|uniref:hypothetical protein n=1 Tax=Saccharopolyspora antimicrobica TaxID=455193 RepID=UPI00147682C4|nr:hypothetical protein [Saccharopolyspora antimicrobica]
MRSAEPIRLLVASRFLSCLAVGGFFWAAAFSPSESAELPPPIEAAAPVSASEPPGVTR